ncbi:MAG: DUF4249 domain-containing protein [Saprospiraceae bacterium]|nr:DUF4249 domain-containing protein [Saprospiraceae bacterium]
MNQFKSKYILPLLFLSTVFYISCEDTIEVDNGFETPQIVVDAWINNTIDETQSISLSFSQDYFDNRLPDPITDASVVVSTETNTFEFVHTSNGTYNWTPPSGERIGDVGETFTLEIQYDGQTLTSTTTLNRVPEIDSISIYFEDQPFGGDEGLFAELYARDLIGKGDTYWVKGFRNDTLLNRPQELNIIYDATFDAGTEIDGSTFIRPLRFAINALDDDGLPRNLDPGEKVGAEIHSISNEAFRFLQIVQEQTTNGDNSIFALPVANSKGNVFKENGDRVLGVFNVAAISKMEKIVEE